MVTSLNILSQVVARSPAMEVEQIDSDTFASIFHEVLKALWPNRSVDPLSAARDQPFWSMASISGLHEVMTLTARITSKVDGPHVSETDHVTIGVTLSWGGFIRQRIDICLGCKSAIKATLLASTRGVINTMRHDATYESYRDSINALESI